MVPPPGRCECLLKLRTTVAGPVLSSGCRRTRNGYQVAVLVTT